MVEFVGRQQRSYRTDGNPEAEAEAEARRLRRGRSSSDGEKGGMNWLRRVCRPLPRTLFSRSSLRHPCSGGRRGNCALIVGGFLIGGRVRRSGFAHHLSGFPSVSYSTGLASHPSLRLLTLSAWFPLGSFVVDFGSWHIVWSRLKGRGMR